jgi:hypothetical protein
VTQSDRPPYFVTKVAAVRPSAKILLQVFSKTVIGPIFFEFIERKGGDGFGEGNFKVRIDRSRPDRARRVEGLIAFAAPDRPGVQFTTRMRWASLSAT